MDPVINNSTNLTNQVGSFALAVVRNFRKSDAMYGRENEMGWTYLGLKSEKIHSVWSD